MIELTSSNGPQRFARRCINPSLKSQINGWINFIGQTKDVKTSRCWCAKCYFHPQSVTIGHLGDDWVGYIQPKNISIYDSYIWHVRQKYAT